MSDVKVIKLINARLSYPNLWHKALKQDGSLDKFNATFLLDSKDKEAIKELQLQIKELQTFHKSKIEDDKICLKIVDDGTYKIKASNDFRPRILDANRNPLTEDDNVLYAGCYVHALISLWYQDNKYGKRINCNLIGVMFVKDGERFTGIDPTQVDSWFDELSTNAVGSVQDL